MVKNILRLFLWLIPIIGHTQQPCSYSFSGIVTDDTGDALIGATIVIEGKGGTTTNERGAFQINNLCSMNYHVSIHYIGYKPMELYITVDGHVNRTIRLEPDLTKLEEVIVHGHHEEIDHAHHYTRLSEQDLAAVAGKSLGESISEVPGVTTLQAGPGIFKPVIHGVHSQRILLLNYGIRQEGQQWGAEHAPEIDPFVASEIIVIKDASSIKYGTDALGGVVIVNPAPLPETAGLGGSLNTIIQSNGRSGTVSGVMEGGIKNLDGWGWRAQGTIKRTGDFKTPDYHLTNTGIRETNFSAATGYHNERFGAEVFFSQFQTELGILRGTAVSSLEDLAIAMEREPPQYTEDFSYDIREPRQEVRHQLLKVNGHLEAQRHEWRFQYGYQSDTRKEFDLRRGSLSGIPAIDLELNTHTLETEWETAHAEVASTCVGITGMYQQNKNIPGTQRIPFIPNFNNLSSGVFGITKFTLPRWTIDIGARYDYRYYDVSGFDYKNTPYTAQLRFHNVSATAGASFNRTPHDVISMNLSSAWRPPHVSELYSVGTHQSAASNEYGLLLNNTTNEVMDIETSSFKNEQALKWVGAYKLDKGPWQTEITAYSNYIFNYIYLRPEGVTQTLRGVYPYLRYRQTNALFTGLDVSVMWQPVSSLQLNMRSSLLRAADKKNDDVLPFIAPNRVEMGARFERAFKQATRHFFVGTTVRYTAKQTRAPRVITPRDFIRALEEDIDLFAEDSSAFDFMPAPDGFFLWNAAAGYSIQNKHVKYELRLAAENLLNTSYRVYTNRFRYYADDIGRNFILSFKITF